MSWSLILNIAAGYLLGRFVWTIGKILLGMAAEGL
jgi:hypothetical protein